MTILGLSIFEVSAILGIVALVVGAGLKAFNAFQTRISAPLIDALDKLRVEVNQLETCLRLEYQCLNQDVEELKQQVRVKEGLS